MKKIFAFFNLILITAIVIGDIFYIQHGTLRIKALTSLMFTMLGTINLFYANLSHAPLGYPIALTFGLFFAMLGDIMLGYSFETGAMLFAIGHVLYFLSFCILTRLKIIDFIPAVILFSVSTLFLQHYPRFRFGRDSMLHLCVGYAFVISMVVGKSLSNMFRCRNAVSVIAALGAVFFFISDLMLVIYKFSPARHIVDTLCLVFYYPAQALLGFSIFLQTTRAVER